MLKKELSDEKKEEFIEIKATSYSAPLTAIVEEFTPCIFVVGMRMVYSSATKIKDFDSGEEFQELKPAGCGSVDIVEDPALVTPPG